MPQRNDRPRRFLCADATHPGQTVRLGPQEGRHAVEVLRLGVGDRVRIFNGAGAEFIGEIESAGAAETHVRLLEEGAAAVRARAALTVAFAPPPGQRADVLVEKASELGAACLIPVLCERVQGHQAEAAGKRIERWQRKAADAARQSERVLVPEIHAPLPLRGLVADPPDGLRLVGAMDEARPLWQVLGEATAPTESVCMLIGPAGGFTRQEQGMATDAGFLPVSLGPTTLRVETAAIVLLAGVVLWLDRKASREPL